MKILSISTCKEKLSEYEFVKPIVEIIKSLDYDIINYRNLETLNLQIYDKVIICGPSLQDNDQLNYLFDFKRLKNPIICLGTTSVRVLETLALNNFEKNFGWTDLFIYPPYNFSMVQGLLTNFHLPKSTLLIMVSAFYGRKKLLEAYKTAVEEKYRFFSFGDCMLIL